MLAVASLSGHHEIPLMVSWTLAAAWAWTVWRRGRAAIVPAAVTFVIAGLIAAVQLWPTAEYARLSRRWVGLESVTWKDAIPYAAPTFYSLPARALPGIAVDDAGSYADSTLSLGIVLTSLAVFAVCVRFRDRLVQALVILAVASVIFALGAATPVHGLLYSFLPMLGKARVPVRAIHLLNFAVVLLAAYGLDALFRRWRPRWSRMMVCALAAFGFASLAGWLWGAGQKDGVVLAGLIALVLSACISGWQSRRLSRATLCATVIGLSLLELYPVSTRTFALANSKQLRALPTLTGFPRHRRLSAEGTCAAADRQTDWENTTSRPIPAIGMDST